MSHHFHFPVAILIHNGELITAAAQRHPEVTKRLADNYLLNVETELKKVSTDITGQKNAQGELGDLTAAQRKNVDALKYWMNQARKTARLAFPNQTVKLHEEFQVGVTGPYDLGSFLGRADIILASTQ